MVIGNVCNTYQSNRFQSIGRSNQTDSSVFRDVMKNAGVESAVGKTYTIRGAFDKSEGRVVGASGGVNNSYTVYEPKDFDPDHPMYKVKIWDEEGNATEHVVDLSEVSPGNSSYIDMYAKSCYLSASGECPDAQTTFMIVGNSSRGVEERTYDSLFERDNWMYRIRDFASMQYKAGNLEGYLKYRSVWEYLLNAGG